MVDGLGDNSSRGLPSIVTTLGDNHLEVVRPDLARIKLLVSMMLVEFLCLLQATGAVKWYFMCCAVLITPSFSARHSHSRDWFQFLSVSLSLPEDSYAIVHQLVYSSWQLY